MSLIPEETTDGGPTGGRHVAKGPHRRDNDTTADKVKGGTPNWAWPRGPGWMFLSRARQATRGHSGWPLAGYRMAPAMSVLAWQGSKPWSTIVFQAALGSFRSSGSLGI